MADHPEFSVLETKDGIIVAVENKDFTFSWEIKCSIKSLDYDPFIEAGNFDDAQAQKAAKKERIAKEKEARIAKIKEKREKKIQEMENKKNEE